MPERLAPNPESLKIGLICPYPVNGTEGGVQEHVRNLAHYFNEQGHQATIVSPKLSGYERDEESQGSTVYYFGKGSHVSHQGTHATVAVIPVSLRSVRRLKNDLQMDVAHFHEPEISSPSLQLLWRRQDIPTVVTFHAVKRPHWYYYLYKPFCWALDGKIDLRVAVSQAVVDFTQRYFPGDYQIIPNGVDTQRFNPSVAKLERFTDAKTNILFVGRLEERKGVTHLIEAFSRIKADNPQTRLIIVGDGPELACLISQAQEARVIDDVVFEGYVPPDKLPSYFSTADIFCSPAVRDESFGIVLLEAMASQKPIIAGDNSGYHELIAHGQEGFLVDPENSEEFAYYLAKLVENEKLRLYMGDNGRQKAQKFDWQNVGKQILECYLKVLDKKKSR